MELLDALYEIHRDWLAGYTFACGRGCSACCTQSVNVTALEGRLVSDYLLANGWGRAGLEQRLGKFPGRRRALLTTNDFARLCFDGVEAPEEEGTPWDFTPCLFLKNNCCTIYPVRPFMCRAFVSTGNCAEQGVAEVAPFMLMANTVFMQLIEHLDQGRPWGNLLDVLALQLAGSTDQSHEQNRLAMSRPLPGFLIPPEEEEDLQPIFKALENRLVQGKSIVAWIEAAHKKIIEKP